MNTQSPAKAGFFSKKTFGAIGAFVLAIMVYVAAKALMGGFTTPERPKSEIRAAISGQKRATFVQSFNDTCLKTQRAGAANKGLPDATIRTYCSCWSEAVANETTNLELLTFAGILTHPQQDRNERLAQACIPKS